MLELKKQESEKNKQISNKTRTAYSGGSCFITFGKIFISF